MSRDLDVIRSSDHARQAPVGYTRLRRGAFVDSTQWASGHLEARQVLRARGVAMAARSRVVFSHVTAAAVRGLPLVGTWDDRVHVTTTAEHPAKSRGDIVRHDVPLGDDEIVEHDGLWITSLARTVFDVMRMLPMEGGLSCLDAALRLVGWDDESRTTIDGAVAALRGDVERLVRAAAGGRGIRRARVVTALGDARSQLPGESVSRLRMWELGFPVPDRQYRVATAAGVFHLDFAWPGLRRFGEFDGEVKLHDPRYTRGRTADEILHDQRRRREEIERATGWQGMHWGWEHLEDRGAWLRRMREQGWPSRWSPTMHDALGGRPRRR